MFERLFILIWPAALISASLSSGTHPNPSQCKPIYGSPHWPSPDKWQQLNESVSGRLVAPTPPGAICHPSFPEYDGTACDLVQSQWSNKTFHALNPVSADYNDVACLPNSTYPCRVEAYPRFVVQAVDAHDVQKAVSFARETGVRLIVKGTGHDMPGRSSGSDALSIQTHRMRGLTLIRDDPRALALGGVASLKIQAGERMIDIYEFAGLNNLTVVGGGELHVGIGGWISHAGHGPVSAYYGMGADQVLEMEVVTADGMLRIFNEASSPDLFWALRGGGASNFAVITSITVKAYDILPYTGFNFAYSTTPKSDTFWSTVTYFYSQLPHLVESGLMGYFWISPLDATERNSSMQGRLYGEWLAPELALHQVRELLAPIEEHIRLSRWQDPVFTSGDGEEHEDFTKDWAMQNPPDTAGVPVRLGSSLLDEEALHKPLPELEHALRRTSDDVTGLSTLGHVIAGPGTWSPKGGIAGRSNAVLPAWRKACMQIAVPRTWDPLNETQKQTITTDLRTNAMQGLRDPAPDMGAYASEADPTEPDWQRAFYGENYSRLFDLKRLWDPQGVFWYKNGVGSELWEPKGIYGVENGVGQNPVQLCRV